MQAVIQFPNISPELFSVEVFGWTLALRWYALAYLAGIVIGWQTAVAMMKRPHFWPNNTPPMTKQEVDDFITALILGIILGGRLVYVFVYKPGYYLDHPSEIIRIDQGGMAFHGGLLGVVVAGLYFSWRHGIAKKSLADAIAIGTPAGIFFGRLANFINGELWGRPTDVPWGVAFPGRAAQDCGQPVGEICARHPSQLYEAGLEGLLIGLVLIVLVRRGGLKRPGLAAGVLMAMYGAARIFVEFFREADAQFIAPDNPYGHVLRLTETVGLSMGQILSLPLIAAGLWLILTARKA